MTRRFVRPACETGELRPDLFLVRCSGCGGSGKGASYGRGGERSKEGRKEGRSSFEMEGTRNLAPLANRDKEKGVFALVVVTGLGWIWVGYALLSQRKETVAEPRLAVR